METVLTPTVLLLPVIPFITAIAVIAAGKHAALRDGLTVVGAAATFCAFLFLIPWVLEGKTAVYKLFTLYPGIHVRFCLDGLGALFAGTSSLLWLLASFYCIGYMRSLNEHAQTRFYVCYAVSVGAALGAACSGNMFTLFLFYEVITIFTYPLVAHHQDKEGYAGGRKYIVYLMFASEALILPALAIIYTQCGTLDFNHTDIANGVFPHGASSALIIASYFLFLFGFAKAAIMPLHSWLPAAMVAPTPVSALLHGVLDLQSNAFCLWNGTSRAVGSGADHSLYCLLYHNCRIDHCHDKDRSESPSGLFNGEPAVIYCARGGAAFRIRDYRRTDSYPQSCCFKDHSVFLRRRHLFCYR